MAYIILGCIGFLCFIFYDFNSIAMKTKLLHGCFFMGVLLVTAATIGIVVSSKNEIGFNIRMTVFGSVSILFFCLLIYTLFFALPFQNTYIDTKDPPIVCQTGVYALCRHPGVLWFIGFYVFLWLALNIAILLIAAVAFSALNIIYICIQDNWTFIRTFKNYNDYKKETPFLIPNRKSIKRCLQTFSGKEHYHEI
jgi:protein-S-isoprenylcysteine O-methyltransferase Ste14